MFRGEIRRSCSAKKKSSPILNHCQSRRSRRSHSRKYKEQSKCSRSSSSSSSSSSRSHKRKAHWKCARSSSSSSSSSDTCDTRRRPCYSSLNNGSNYRSEGIASQSIISPMNNLQIADNNVVPVAKVFSSDPTPKVSEIKQSEPVIVKDSALMTSIKDLTASLVEKSSDDENKQCSICLDREKSVVLVRCGHRYCLFDMKQQFDKNNTIVCPMCSQVATDIMRCYD